MPCLRMHVLCVKILRDLWPLQRIEASVASPSLFHTAILILHPDSTADRETLAGPAHDGDQLSGV